MLLAESVLMATGLVEQPTRTHERASRRLLEDAAQTIIDALDREQPARLIVCPARVSYFDRLTDPFDYAAAEAVLEPVIGTEAADAYQALHKSGREVLKALRPRSTINTVMGDVPLPLDAISEGRWAIEVDVVEGLRLPKDIAAGALLKEEVDVFSAIFPESYAFLLGELDRALAKRAGASKTWQPPPWLADSLRVFERKPFGATLEIAGPKPPNAPPPAPPKGGKLDTEALKTRSQTT
jgi:hypothetical protein